MQGLVENLQHIRRIHHHGNKIVKALMDRLEKHDASKLESPEREGYEEVHSRLSGLEYDSPEYKENLKLLGPTLLAHYSRNRHHIEHHKNGIEDMNILDLVELLIDWRAASERNKNGNIKKSIERNAARYNINPQLVKILENSAILFDE